MTMFAAIATVERKIMLERQREGIALAKSGAFLKMLLTTKYFKNVADNI